MFALVDQWIDQQEFSEYWHSITGDSMVVDVRRVKKEKGHGYSKAAAEVCKYALKFGDLSVEKTWEAFKVLKGKRLTGSFGLLWGVKIPDTMTDDMPEHDLPYLEMLYKFVSGKQSYYDLASTRHVEPQANIERMSEDERSDRPTRHERNIASGESVGWMVWRTLYAHHHATPNRKSTGRFPSNPCSGSATNPKMGRIFI